MENREQQIFLEIREMISSVRAQLDALEAKVASLSQELVVEEVEDEPIELDIEDVLEDIPVSEPVAEEPFQVPEVPVVEEPVLIDDVPPVVSEEQVVEEDLPVAEILIDAAAANAKIYLDLRSRISAAQSPFMTGSYSSMVFSAKTLCFSRKFLQQSIRCLLWTRWLHILQRSVRNGI